MKRNLSLLLFIFATLLSTSSLYAVPATPYPFTVSQPDGTELTIYLRGDEFFHYKTTLDGYTLTTNSLGILTYANVDAVGNFIDTKIKASNIGKRTAQEHRLVASLNPNFDFSKIERQKRIMRAPSSGNTVPQKSYPLTGSPKSLVILVNFSDLSFVVPQAQTAYTNLLNQKGYSTNFGTGSAKDYFRDNSMGVFNPQFDVAGPFNLPNTTAYYGANTNNTAGQDTNPRQMVIDACTLAAASGVDFSQYDTDHDGVVDNIFIYYAGYNEAEGGPANSIWPHRWVLANKNTRFNGVAVYDYACTSELRSRTGSNMCGIGTFCHEFGHVLGLPDYYPTNGASHHTLSYWNVMDAGPYLNNGRTPPSYSAFDRFYLNWLVPTELKDGGDYSLDTLSTKNKAYIITQSGNSNLVGSSPSPAEFFTLENRQNTGWDTYLPGHGMLVSHIYYNANDWSNNVPNNNPNAMDYIVIPADGIASDNSLSGDPFPGTSNVKSYIPVLRDGTDIRKPLTFITETNGIIQFHFASNIILTGDVTPFSTVQGTPSAAQSITVSGTKLTNPIVISFAIGSHFEIKKQTDPDTGWGKSITLNPGNSVVGNTVIQIRYNPSVPSYTLTHTETLKIISGTTDKLEVALSGTSTRPVYVVPPVAIEPTNITFYGFTANWNPVFDAVGYYLTVYNISAGESSLIEGFDSGLTPSPNWTITAKATSTSALYSGKSTPAIQFSNTGESVLTEKYMLPVTKLSFFLRSLGGNNGGFLIEGQNQQNTWEKVDSILVITEPSGYDTSKRVKNYSFTTGKNYIRFRFTYTKGIGSVTFDDVTVTFSSKIDYVLRDKWETTTTVDLTNLEPTTEYVFKVRASDKSTVHSYENITDFSNEIQLNTLQYPLAKSLLATVDANRNATVYLPNLDYSILIYNTLGQNIRNLTPTGNTVTITDLPRNQLYIIKAGNRVVKVAI